jgi:hypothetical protein
LRNVVTDRPPPKRIDDLTPEQARNRRMRNIAIGLAVGFLAVLFYAITIVKIGPGILRPEP